MYARIEISTAALAANARTLAELIGTAVPSFVVKANAYGHGLATVAKAVEGIAHSFCVYGIDEAVALRDAGITKPILVLGPLPPESIDEALARNIEFALWDTRSYARDIIAASQRRRITARVHVKVNTGLNRLGIDSSDLADAVEDAVRMPELHVEGVFSHLASAEEMDSPYTMYQLERFQGALDAAGPIFAAAGVHPRRHIAASAAAMLWPKTRLDMARMGIALYGLWPSAQTKIAMNGNAVDLQPALAYRTQLVVVRSIAAGSAVGYGCSFHAPRAMRIGVVPLGYADGIPRALSNRGGFLVDGARAPIVGRVAMNMTVVDLTDAPNAHVGSAVTLIGTDGEASVSADDWGAWADTINYEIVTRLPSTLPRSYV